MVGHAVSAGSSAARPGFGGRSPYAGAFVQRAIRNFHPSWRPRLTLGLPWETRRTPNAITGQLEPLGRCTHA